MVIRIDKIVRSGRKGCALSKGVQKFDSIMRTYELFLFLVSLEAIFNPFSLSGYNELSPNV